MKLEEEVALEHLRFRGFHDVRPHPDGTHRPPDFLVNGRIAVEVRRLNQNERGRDTPRGLEVVAIPLIGRFRKLLGSFGNGGATRWYVVLQLKRPLPKWTWFRPRLRSALQAVLDAPEPPDRVELDLATLHLELIRRLSNGPTFAFGAFLDTDSGGWVLQELERNLRLCIAEKTAKIAPHRERYPEWWLVLVDMITHGLTSEAIRSDFRESVSVDRQDWHRIILVNPLDHRDHFEV